MSSHSSVECILLGTGTSSSIPHVDCLTALPEAKPCRTCLSTLKPEGKKNIRRNTSAVFRIPGKDGQKVTIVVDVGKNFQAAAVEWFPKYGLRKIDAVLLTHPHADAMNGLDDLRGWTLNKSIQSHVDLYVSQDTFIEVQRSFPYLVSKEFASGGGDVPEFKWHIIEDTVPFEILDTGIIVTPFLVHHGRVFSQPPTPVYMPSPLSTTPGTPNVKFTNPTPIKLSALHARLEKQAEVIHPYKCFGFRFGQEVTYISDVSHIPEDKWSIIQPSGDRRLPVLVLDCLRLKPHTSHMGLEGSVDTARRIGASRTYLTGFSHDVSHDEFVTFGEAVGGMRKGTGLTEVEKQGLELVKSGQPAWVRPAHDGLRIFVEEDGRVRDETY